MSPPTQITLTSRAWAELVLLALIWGGVFLATRIALDEITVLQAVAHRVVWAAAVLWLYVAVRGLPVPRDVASWGALLVMGLLNNALPFTLMAWGQLHIESGLTSIFNATTAIFGVLVAALFLADEPLTPRRIAGVALGFLGVVTTIGADAFGRFDPRALAQLAVLGGAMSYAFAGVWARRRLRHLSPPVAAAGMLTGSSLILLPLAIVVDGSLPMALSARSVAAIGYYAVVATALAYLLYYRVLAMAGSGNLMLVTLLIPPVAIGLGVVVLGETLAPRALFGFALLALGLVVLDGRWRRMLRRRRRD